jgi:hypothetical protein
MAQPDTTPTTLDAALRLAAQGFHVFPVIANGKLPAIGGWPHRATRDPETIRSWWTEVDPVMNVTRVKDYNVGICGSRLGDDKHLLIVDVDTKGDGPDTIRGLELLYDADWTDTFRVETPSGGFHLYFVVDQPAATTAKRIGAGLDTRGFNGFVVAPGSTINGKAYRFTGGTVRAAPDWLVEKVGAPPERTKDENVLTLLDMQPALDRAIDWLINNAPVAELGARGSTAYKVAARIREFGVSEMAARDLMVEHWNARCEPPMEFEDLSLSVAHAYEYAREPLGSASPLDFDPVTEEEIEIPVEGREAKPAIKATPFVWRDPRTIPTRKWVYGRHYIRKFVSATVAPGGVGKSSLSVVEALAMATGRNLLGTQPVERVRVWLWNGEDPKEEIERRIAAACLFFEIDPKELDGWLFVDSGRDTEIIMAATTRDGSKISVPTFEAVRDTILENKIDVAIFDPFVSSHRVTENDNMAIDAVAKTWGKIADVTNASIDLIHHSRKTGGEEVTVEDSRGASALVSASRSARVLNRMTKEEAEKARVQQPRAYFRVDNGKANLAAPPDKADWFHLESVPLRNGDGPHDDGDEVAVVAPWEWQEADVLVTEIEKTAILEGLRDGTWREDARANRWGGIVVMDVMKMDRTATGSRSFATELLRSWINAGDVLRVVERRDDSRQMRRFLEVI